MNNENKKVSDFISEVYKHLLLEMQVKLI